MFFKVINLFSYLKPFSSIPQNKLIFVFLSVGYRFVFMQGGKSGQHRAMHQLMAGCFLFCLLRQAQHDKLFVVLRQAQHGKK
jgi:hypothetical protein